MQRYIISRLLNLIPVVLLITFLVFLVTYLIPGDPALMMLGNEATPEQVEAAREQLGLNEPFFERYLVWVGNVLQGDLGNSYRNNEPVWDLIARAFPITASILPRWRTIPASPSSRSTSRSPKRAIASMSQPAKALRYPSRLRRIVDQESPACAPSRFRSSKSFRSSRSGTPHSSS